MYLTLGQPKLPPSMCVGEWCVCDGQVTSWGCFFLASRDWTLGPPVQTNNCLLHCIAQSRDKAFVSALMEGGFMCFMWGVNVCLGGLGCTIKLLKWEKMRWNACDVSQHLVFKFRKKARNKLHQIFFWVTTHSDPVKFVTINFLNLSAVIFVPIQKLLLI